jgi:hypothetical protein
MPAMSRLTSLDSPFQTVEAGTTLKMISRIQDKTAVAASGMTSEI